MCARFWWQGDSDESETIPSGTDRIAEAASKVGLTREDLVVNIQGDQPTLDYRCIPYLIGPLQG